jgi:hypothetical protein
VVPLELWDVIVDGVPLYLVPEASQPQAMAEVVRLLLAGTARRFRTSAHALSPRVIDRVVVAGGGAVDDVVSALHGIVPAVAANDPLWLGERGGRALVHNAGGEVDGCLVVDVGQTSIKRSWRGQRERRPRDLDRIPLEMNARTPAIRIPARRETVAFLARALGCTPAPTSVVLGLPCEIDDALRVAGCSYPWDDDDDDLIPSLLSTAWIGRDVTVLVLNDAELAAVGVDDERDDDGATLVLTVGLGLGAAWLPPRR